MERKVIFDTSFWQDTRITRAMTNQDKYFMLYLLTNPKVKTSGKYYLDMKTMAKHLGYDLITVELLLDRFKHDYKLIDYNKTTEELIIR